MEGLSKRSSEDIRKEFREEFGYNLLAMAENYGRTLREMAAILAREDKREEDAEIPESKKLNATFNVRFTPAVNVEVAASNPFSPTEEEIEEIVSAAKKAVEEDTDKHFSRDTLESIRLISIEGKVAINVHPVFREIFTREE